MALELVTKDDLKEFATKKDLEALREDLADVRVELIDRMATKEDLADMTVELTSRIDQVDKKADSILSTMLAAMDELRHDIVGVFRDEVSSIKNRLNKLERRV